MISTNDFRYIIWQYPIKGESILSFGRYCNGNYTFRMPPCYMGNMNSNNCNTCGACPQAEHNSCQNTENGQKVCKTEYALPCTKLVSSSFGGIILSNSQPKGAAYDLVVLNLNPMGFDDVLVDISFACNVALIKTSSELSFQLYRLRERETIPMPVSSPVTYIKNTAGTMTDSIFLHAFDSISLNQERCIYMVKLHSAVKIPGGGLINVMNPVLTAII